MRQMRRVLVILIVMTGISCATVDFEPTPIDPEKVNEDFRRAVQSGDTLEVEHLLYMGAEVNKADADGLTPLMFTSYSGHLEVDRLLIEAGADVNARSNKGGTALIMASQRGHTALLLTVHFGYPEVTRVLVEAGADIAAQDNNGYSALI